MVGDNNIRPQESGDDKGHLREAPVGHCLVPKRLSEAMPQSLQINLYVVSSKSQSI